MPVALHPIFVHFAIALTLFGVALDAAALFLERPAWHAAARLCWGWGAISIFVAAGFGWLDHARLHAGGGHLHSEAGGEWMEIHERLGWTLVALSGALFLWRWRLGERVGRTFLALAAAVALGVAVQGTIGGELVFRHGIGVVHADHDAHEGVAGAPDAHGAEEEGHAAHHH